MQAVILAAGMGRRLKEHTKDKTKCMVNVGGQTIIERGLRILDAKGLSRIVIVTGYKSEGLTEHVNSLKLSTPVVYINKIRVICIRLISQESISRKMTLL